MLNPKDLETMDTEEGKEMFSEEMLAEFSNGKGDDEDDEPVQQQPAGDVHQAES